MRDLVYRVMELPASMRALVYDFGRLSDEMERKYIFEIVKNQLNEMQQKLSVQVVNEISRMFDVCQRFMRDSKVWFLSLLFVVIQCTSCLARMNAVSSVSEILKELPLFSTIFMNVF